MSLAGKHDFTIEEGSAWERVVTWNNAAGSPVDLTGYTARMMARLERLDTSTVMSLTSPAGGIALGGAAGTITLSQTAVQTALLSFDRAEYDLEVLPAGAEADAIRLLEGFLFLSREVTR